MPTTSRACALATLGLVLGLPACSSPPRPLEARAGASASASPTATPSRDFAAEIADLEARRGAGVDGLRRLLGAPEAGVRARALRGLGRIGDAAAIEAISPALADPDPAIAAAAAPALGLVDRPIDVAPLLARLDRPEAEVRVAALDALGRLGDASTIPAITRAVGDDDDAVASAAGLALGRLGRRSIALSDAAEAALIHETWSLARDRRAAAVFALARAHVADHPRAQADADAPPEGLAAAIALCGRLADEDPAIRAEAAIGCGRRGLRGDPALVRALADPAWTVRLEAARALAAADGPPGAREALANALVRLAHEVLQDRSHRTWPDLHVLEDSLLRLRASAREPRIAALAAELAAASGEALAQSRPPAGASRLHCAAAALGARASGDLAALARCGGLPGRGMAPHLRDALLLEALGEGLGDGFGGIEPYRRAEDPRVRAAAITAISAIAARPDPEPAAIDALITALGDPSSAVVGAAAEGLLRAASSPALRPRLDAAIAPTIARARAAHEAGDLELTLTLLGLLRALESEAALPLCRGLTTTHHAGLRDAALACINAVHARPPEEDPEAPPRAPPPPPFDPREVLGHSIAWYVTTTRGTILIDLDPEVAPQSVAALVALAERGFYDGLPWHRVVADFVVQGGDPEGTGWGGPGFALATEASWRPFDRGAVGIADAGKDSGGSQWFLMQSRAPHLEGRYTWVGRVVDGEAIVDGLTTDDRILHTRVVRSR